MRPYLWLLVVAACDTPADPDGDEPVEDVLPGTPITLTNASFEDSELDAGVEQIQRRDRAAATTLEIPGWIYVIEDDISGVGLIRPTSERLGAAEPLAAPAKGRIAALLDTTGADGAAAGRLTLGQPVPEVFAAGDRVYARMAFASRADDPSVPAHASARLVLAVDKVEVASIPAAPSPDGWADVTVEHEITAEQAGLDVVVAVIVEQADVGDAQVQTYVDHLRVTVERADAP